MFEDCKVKAFPAWRATVAAVAVLVCLQPTAGADVTLGISGTFGEYTWDHGPLDNGSFSGTVTLGSLPSANSRYAADVTADVSFYNSANQLVFSVINSASSPVWATLTEGSSGYTELTVSGYGIAGHSTVDVASLDLKFNSDGSFNSASSVEYTYCSPSTTYFAPLTTASVSTDVSVQTQSAPEPSTLAVSLVSTLGCLIYAWFTRRPATV